MRRCMMFWRTCKRCVEPRMTTTNTKTTKGSKFTKKTCLFVFFDLFVAFVLIGTAQGVDPGLLLKPTPDSWPTYHGDYTGQHHSRLTQITPSNVHQITLAWAFQTNLGQPIKATP